MSVGNKCEGNSCLDDILLWTLLLLSITQCDKNLDGRVLLEIENCVLSLVVGF